MYEEVFVAAGEAAAKAAIDQKEKEYAERDAKLKQDMHLVEAEAERRVKALEAERLAAETEAAEAQSVAQREITRLQENQVIAQTLAGRERALRLGAERDLLTTCLHVSRQAEKNCRLTISAAILVAMLVCQLA